MVKDDLFFKNIEQNPISFMFSHMKSYYMYMYVVWMVCGNV